MGYADAAPAVERARIASKAMHNMRAFTFTTDKKARLNVKV